jgi:hypothetical protein
VARFEIKHEDCSIGICCPVDGNTDMFQHNPNLLTCNKCGHTFRTPSPATVIVEQVVLKYHDSQ